ncbi:ribbon-helix-helix domain-containing protein [Paenibacillus pasadenensis]|uniref:ribbon-helix-helix domain-containing protein n=1 Tax=Paenibacillus pasadenensis TaxID=217090 RepID=UPI0011AECFE0|nr:ribbon-helix-helix domain-containing protein [Paenibacillus pasadenensis]
MKVLGEPVYEKKLLRISNVQGKKLKILKQTTGIAESEHMRRALDLYFEKLNSEGKT